MVMLVAPVIQCYDSEMRPGSSGSVALETEAEIVNARLCAAMLADFLPYMENNPTVADTYTEACDYLLANLEDAVDSCILGYDQAEALVGIAERAQECVGFSNGVLMGLRIVNFEGSSERLATFAKELPSDNPDNVPASLINICVNSMFVAPRIYNFCRLVFRTLPEHIVVAEL